jgi:hypothetical protein
MNHQLKEHCRHFATYRRVAPFRIGWKNDVSLRIIYSPDRQAVIRAAVLPSVQQTPIVIERRMSE